MSAKCAFCLIIFKRFFVAEGSHVSSAEGNANHIEKTVSQGVTVPKPATCDKLVLDAV